MLSNLILFFSFLLNKVFVAASKPKENRNKINLIFYASNSPPIDSRAKYIKKKFPKILIKILRLISKAPPQLLLICRQILMLIT